MPTSDEELGKDISWKVVFAKWLVQQGVPAVLLFSILFVMSYGMHYAIETAIPEHLKTIQLGYDRMQEAHAKEESRLAEMFEKTLDRIESAQNLRNSKESK